jgi:hypothetical protein
MSPRWLLALALLSAACSFNTDGLHWIAPDLGKQPGPPPRDFRWPDSGPEPDLPPPDLAISVDVPTPADLPPPDKPPPGQDLPSCGSKLTWCGSCVDLTSNKDHCGACNRPCGALTCCASACVNPTTDNKNCGKCGNTCTAPNTCQKGTCTAPPVACASGTTTQSFGNGMWGCKGTVQYKDRAGLCGTSFHVCKANEWVTRHGSMAPTHIYWTDDFVYADSWTGTNCVVRLTPSTWCGQSGWPPMRVCPNSGIDVEANTCNWTGCGFQQQYPNQYFGGCEKNYTAGSLCCS